MKVLSRLASVVSAFAILAFAAPVTAQNVKYFDLFAPAGPISVSTQTVDITFKNIESGNSTFNAVAVAWTKTPGISSIVVTDAKSYPGNLGSYVDLPGDEIAVTGLPPTKKNQSITIRLTIAITASSCGGGSITWSGRAWTGSVSSPSTQFMQNNSNPETVVAGPTCTVEFERAPANALLLSGTASISSVANILPNSTNSVRAVVKNGGVVDTTYAGPISIERVAYPAGSTIAGNTVAVAADGTAEFPLLSVNAVGVYSLRATAGTFTPSIAVPILVSDGTLDCLEGSNIVPPSVTGANWVVERHEYIYDPKFGCTAINYLATRGNASGVTDPAGFFLGTDFFSIIYNEIPSEGVLLTHEYISTVYPVPANGVVTNKVVRYCETGDGDCTNLNKNSLPIVPACLNGGINQGAIPGTPGQFPGCLRSFGWFSVACPLPPFVSFEKGCVQYQFGLLEAKDPPWGMTDE